ncbi:tRNA A64-2'-O-ribosylphosphate transferase isoform X1 [Dendrobium catenatum]|uniref:tRNA A64-2'-O-ribosylphosphate transferase n=1 Tax=Dendrobium catenatum TaxID=906689 RepID=A0A2I0WYF1_9ASPA|nr:tRNA A64-2'-O-ribosylphosphate transferase isoform X1 [Dendrobium catenatum]PKU80691.1 tRNA A64-2'-O-ribosylphosphate transferase [Dendrobium catenatum]
MAASAAALAELEEERVTSIYRVARSIKRKHNSLYNALRSIYEDSIFVAEIAGLWPDLPLVANLRCGLWYSPRFEATCYFKSTDGHANNWSFSTSRLNLHLALLAGQRGGCIVVDSTRKGKRFPDSMSKTIPIWTCVLNRAIERWLRRMPRQIQVDGHQDLSISSSEIMERHNSPDWDCSLHLPLWVSNTERAAIEDHIEEWTWQLEACGADIDSLASIIQKPLRPLWISQKTVIWLNEVPNYDSWDFTPIILVSASASHGTIQQRSTSEFSWHYIPGAGDDEESWARGLHPTLFWKHAYNLIDSGPSMCNQNVSELVEKDRVYRAQRGDFSPQVAIRTWKKLTSNAEQSCMSMTSELSDSVSAKSSNSERGLYWIGSTNVAVGTTVKGENTYTCADCILNCDPKSISPCSTDDGYLHLPILSSKLDRFSLMNSLHLAIRFAGWHLKRGKKLVICCHNGEDISICVCLAILAALFDEEGCFDDGKLYKSTIITKWEMRRRLVFICKFAVNARPSRGNLKQVYGFLRREREHFVPTDPVSDFDVLEQKSWAGEAEIVVSSDAVQ